MVVPVFFLSLRSLLSFFAYFSFPELAFFLESLVSLHFLFPVPPPASSSVLLQIFSLGLVQGCTEFSIYPLGRPPQCDN